MVLHGCWKIGELWARGGDVHQLLFTCINDIQLPVLRVLLPDDLGRGVELSGVGSGNDVELTSEIFYVLLKRNFHFSLDMSC